MNTEYTTSAADELVQVSVPRHLLTAVYAFIAEHDQRPSPPGTTDEEPPEHDENSTPAQQTDWSIEDFKLLLGDPRPSTARVVKVLDVLAGAPEEKFSTTRLGAATGLSRGELRGGFSGFSRVCKSLRPGVQMAWPIQLTWGVAEQEGFDSETFYYLSTTFATRWTKARAM
ncbi:hypothetical protein [uncultured Pseudonocardia sp.]|uniref:hypothetical protein n=1 Tax=uncultured Pseudonocardia sp. TaxID=211455 RepID=UPI002613D72E|nr:hypothetical protein [uncultured Pseudonocardia sp.]